MGRIRRRLPFPFALVCSIAVAACCLTACTVLLAARILTGAPGAVLSLLVIAASLAGIGVTAHARLQLPLRRLVRATAARARVARELNASQPLGTGLAHVCATLRSGSGCDAAVLIVGASEMSDAFAVADGVPPIALEQLLHGTGPIARAYHAGSEQPVVATAAPDTGEALVGMRAVCAAPLRAGGRVHGVLALARGRGAITQLDVDLVAGAEENVAVALERYRFLVDVQRQASTDDLTGLHNHRFFVDYLAQQAAVAERQGTPLALLMLDVDHFKALNDTHGHPSGDVALAAFAQTVLASVRRSDLAARYGGEEFAVVMANTSARDARLVAEKIRTAVEAVPVELPDRSTVHLTVSIGVAACPEDASGAASLIAVADRALYQAKHDGRNRTCTAADVRDAESPAAQQPA